ncbi:MAG TPA: nicotinate-nucleotide adenylyltransferase [Dehalococcoidia bacterium]
MRIGVLGGTFDPIHTGHLILASCAADQLKLDKVLFIPAGDPWRKAARTVTAGAKRLEMVRLATTDDPRFDLDDRELRREGPTYTSDTIRELKAECGPQAQLFFLAGEDALDDMRFWHKPDVIFAAARLAVAPRMATPLPSPPDHEGASLELPEFERINMPYVGISSSDVRERAARGGSLRYLVPDAVDHYIKQEGLYRPLDR